MLLCEWHGIAGVHEHGGTWRSCQELEQIAKWCAGVLPHGTDEYRSEAVKTWEIKRYGDFEDWFVMISFSLHWRERTLSSPHDPPLLFPITSYFPLFIDKFLWSPIRRKYISDEQWCKLGQVVQGLARLSLLLPLSRVLRRHAQQPRPGPQTTDRDHWRLKLVILNPNRAHAGENPQKRSPYEL